MDSENSAYALVSVSAAPAQFGSFAFSTTGRYLIKISPNGNCAWAVLANTGEPFGLAVSGDGRSFLTSRPLSAPTQLTCFDATGRRVWDVSLGTYAYDIRPFVSRSATRVIVCGIQSASVTFGMYSLARRGAADVYLGAVTSDGQLAWANTMGGYGSEVFSPYAVAEEDRIVTAGTFFYQPRFGDTYISSAGKSDIFVVPFAADIVTNTFQFDGQPHSLELATNATGVIIDAPLSTNDYAVFYSLDGSTPGATSTPLNGPTLLTTNATLNAVAYNLSSFEETHTAPQPIAFRRGFYLRMLPHGGGQVVNSSGNLFNSFGTPFRLTASPIDGMRFVRWTGDVTNSTNPLDLSATREWQIGALFEPLPAFTVTFKTNGCGSISGATNGSYTASTKLSVVAVPCPGWAFSGWSGSVSSFAPSVSVVVSEAIMLEARFVPIVLSTRTAGGGHIEGNTNVVYPVGSSVRLIARADLGWEFLYWTGDMFSTNPTLDVLMTESRALEAVFGTRPRLVPTGGGTIACDVKGPAVAYGSMLTCVGVPDIGNYLALWGGAARGTNMIARVRVTNATPTIQALFLETPSQVHSLSVTTTGLGFVDVQPAANVYSNGQNVTLLAEPALGQSFRGWSPDTFGAQPRITIQMTTGLFLTAHFTTNVSFAEPMAIQGRVDSLLGGPPGVYEIDVSQDARSWRPMSYSRIPEFETDVPITLTNSASTGFFRARLLQ